MTARLPRVYAAYPMVTYHTEHAAERLAAVAGHFPGWRVLDPAGLYRTDTEWLAAWPELVGTLSALVIFGDWTGTVGTGVMREVTDALYLGLPVALLHDGRLHELLALDLIPADLRCPASVAWPVAGPAAEGFARALVPEES